MVAVRQWRGVDNDVVAGASVACMVSMMVWHGVDDGVVAGAWLSVWQ